jgi:hypothetical protein
VQATSAIRERLPLGAISRPTLAGLLTAIGADEPPEARRAPAGRLRRRAAAVGRGARTA